MTSQSCSASSPRNDGAALPPRVLYSPTHRLGVETRRCCRLTNLGKPGCVSCRVVSDVPCMCGDPGRCRTRLSVRAKNASLERIRPNYVWNPVRKRFAHRQRVEGRRSFPSCKTTGDGSRTALSGTVTSPYDSISGRGSELICQFRQSPGAPSECSFTP